jgi:spore germination cell wall hydrolase CwlJ-like protein
MNAVQQWFDRHHTLLLKAGGTIAFIFLAIFVPAKTVIDSENKLKQQQEISQQLAYQLEEVNKEMEYYRLSFNRQQEVQKEIRCLAQNIYYEAGSEPVDGKVAVAEVTMNRVRSGSFPATVCGVVNQKVGNSCQFSWVCKPKKPITMKSEWNQSLSIAQNILIKRKKYSTIPGAKFFHADYVDPSWADTKEFVRKVGRHLFYKD